MNHIISWSGGKDSTATIILLKEHERELLAPGDKVYILFSEVMFDNKHKISGHNPDIIKFIYQKKKIFESWGYTVVMVKSDKDYLTRFHEPLTRCPNPERNGLKRGFPLQKGMCWVKRDLKIKPMNDFFKTFKEEYISYVGFAIDESQRFDSYKKEIPNSESLLIKYGLTEADARKLCIKYKMLSPQYLLYGGKQKRDGCWFCPYAKECEHRAIREKYPDAWQTYVSLEKEDGLGYPKWFSHAKETLSEREMRFASEENRYRQMSLSDYFDITA